MPLGPQNIDLQKSLQQLASGGLPTRATLRLQEEAGPNKRLFTSDLTVNEFLVSREVNIQPISQVMGSSIYHIGRIGDYKGKTGEIESLSQAHREARQRALARLWLEAQAVRADVVLGVHLAERQITKGAHGKGGDDGDEVIEFTVVGTAARAPWLGRPAGDPVVTDLSGQDLWALARDGYAPCGLVFDFCRYHVWHVMDPSNWTAAGEVTSASNAVDTARKIVEQRIIAQSKRFGAQFVVGSDIDVEVEEVACGWHGCHLNDLDIDVAWFGTAIRRMENAPRPTATNVPPLVLGMMPLGRKKHQDVVEGEEDESAELKKEAKEEEEKATEKDDEGGED